MLRSASPSSHCCTSDNVELPHLRIAPPPLHRRPDYHVPLPCSIDFLRHCATLFTMSYFFSTPLDIDIRLEDNDDNRQMVDVKLDKNRTEKCPLYMDGETVKGAVTIRPKDGKRLEHTGIKVQFIGTIGQRAPDS